MRSFHLIKRSFNVIFHSRLFATVCSSPDCSWTRRGVSERRGAQASLSLAGCLSRSCSPPGLARGLQNRSSGDKEFGLDVTGLWQSSVIGTKPGVAEEQGSGARKGNITESRNKLIKMSTVRKHFGLKGTEETYIFKELEKVRQENKKDFLQFKQKLLSRPTVDESPIFGLESPGLARQEEVESVSPAGLLKPSGLPAAKGLETSSDALFHWGREGTAHLPGSSEAATYGKSQPFCPQDFYLRSSAFLRHRPQKKPPVIASHAGTAKSVVLMPPPPPRGRPRARWGPKLPRPVAINPVVHRGSNQEHEAAAAEPRKAKGKSSSVSSEEREGRVDTRRRSRGKSRMALEHQAATASETREGAGSVFKIGRRSVAPRDSLEAGAGRATPRLTLPPLGLGITMSLEEITSLLQSEAQLASDQTVKELIQRVLGQNYDMKMEDITLMGKICSQKTPQELTEQGIQTCVEEAQMEELEELPEVVSSLSQIEQEDISEWGISDAESTVGKPPETSEVKPAEQSNVPLENKVPEEDSKAAKQKSLKLPTF
ncbi:PREDICTED: uncharacterized protein LOC101636440 [Condylura cristata]|uniref:uncharacterized protein LOC101636440 n=1 Tax=Condylura cristata TaxID=143302 RepID=UPI00033436DB|nr:PREDICTED: uncharacterized protein LOC101636440 [Condylura cristata]